MILIKIIRGFISVKRLMNQKGFSGVPLLLVTVDSTEHIISGHDLYGGAKSIGEALAKLA
ncbi:hypothetical protein A9K82_03165 [Enterobacter kobei]|nr:hypothetical protein A9K82_03165 [Enterobacter kobei]